ncbi:BTAD domain-containing putative transcriptional regulator [Nocardioides sp. SLBN-35]|uniref:BTAD domain-containing putative transcriptional regulator n=1 Tax=Nocardioides sp. SLBN-35 TaxID=2768445 RepID=UPI001151DFDB|nr:BTAD domain-containing putative transcriptional regulator [Nocardioides sp. SLBN-35]
MRMRVLGPVEVEVDGRPLDLGAPKPRRLLAVLALHRGRPVSPETIAEALWGDEPPASHAVTIQGYVSGLRKILEPERAPRGASTVIQTSALGYALRLPLDDIDAARLEAAVRSAGATARTDRDRPWLLAGSPDPADLAAAAELLDEALEAWRGEPYADLVDDPVIAVERSRLHEVRTAAVEIRELIRMQRGDAAAAARRLEAEAAGQPHRERLWLLYAAALVRAERQVDALAALRRLRDALRDELGVDASPAVGALETAILQQRVAPGAAAEPTPALRVAVVDDHPMFRMGMTGLLGSLDGLELVGAAGESATARKLVSRGVDVVLMDLDLAGESGIELTRELMREHPDLKVLVMTMHEDDDHVAGALHAGAAGYLLKSAEADDVLRAIRGVARGELIIGSAVAGAARSRLAGPGDPR